MSRLDDEIAVLQSIYEAAFEELQYETPSSSSLVQRRIVRYKDEFCTIKLSLPSTYPTCEDCNVSVMSLTFHGIDHRIISKVDVMRQLEDIIAANAAAQQETLFDVCEYLRGRSYTGSSHEKRIDIAEKAVETAPAADCHNLSTIFRQPLAPSTACPSLQIFHGEVVTERKSMFHAHMAWVTSMNEVETFRDMICQDKKYAKATHNIFAYRFTCPRTGVVYSDNDDDGEDAAGGRLAELLRLMGADGVAVIVSRWFGGTLLGPDRFKFISNAARKLLEEQGVGQGGKQHTGGATKLGKVS